MAVAWLARAAAKAAVPVYACVGPGMLAATERLFLTPALRRAQTPRAAAILLVAGEMPDSAREAMDRVHDQIPPPRASLDWDGTGDPIQALRSLWAELVAGRGSEADRRPDAPPNPWRGKGDHGQGGKGMMGGVPYGRPMAMTADDPRDGLALDAYTLRLGPFAPMLPPGLVLEVTLQGDMIVSAEVCAPPFAQPPDASTPAACTARLLRLLGLRPEGPRAPFAYRAVPAGLGAASGTDIRSRLHDWTRGQNGPAVAPTLANVPPGLEWHEAMLMLNSWSPEALRRACLAEVVA